MKNLAILFCFFPTTFCLAQLQEDDKTFAATAEYINFQQFSPTYAFGITGEYMLGDHVGIEFSAAGAKDYFQFGTGAILFPIALLISGTDSDGDGNSFLLFLIGIASLFEHTNYHIPLNKNIELVPYVSLLKVRYMYEPESEFDEYIFASWSIGTKLGFRFNNNLFINASVEGSQLYYSGRPKESKRAFTSDIFLKVKENDHLLNSSSLIQQGNRKK